MRMILALFAVAKTPPCATVGQTDHNSETHCPQLRILPAQLIPESVSLRVTLSFIRLSNLTSSQFYQFPFKKRSVGQLYKWPHSDLLR